MYETTLERNLNPKCQAKNEKVRNKNIGLKSSIKLASDR